MLINDQVQMLLATLTPEGGKLVVKRAQINDALASIGLKWQDVSHVLEDASKVNKPKRGYYDLTELSLSYGLIGMSLFNSAVEDFIPPTVKVEAERQTASGIKVLCNMDAVVPAVDSLFVPWGEFDTVCSVIKSGKFFPFSISGPSGNGKTLMVKQACAKLEREYIRVQVSPQTDEDDLIGGLRLINGDTVFAEGPVIAAMRRGAILLIDEMDRATNKIMCLQGVLEGEPVLVKKTGEIVHPQPGFNVIATMNTKGRGSDDGRYIAASVIDDAFLERFKIMIEQPFASEDMEEKILAEHFKHFNNGSLDENAQDWVKMLVKLATKIRKDAEEGDDIISTRRLCHIVETCALIGDDIKAFAYGVSRFETQTRDTWNALYKSMRPDPKARARKAAAEKAVARTAVLDDDAAAIASRILNP
jgi:MoxR-like ATPase